MSYLKITVFSLLFLFLFPVLNLAQDNVDDEGGAEFVPATWTKENNIIPASPTAANLGTYFFLWFSIY